MSLCCLEFLADWHMKQKDKWCDKMRILNSFLEDNIGCP